VGAALGGHHLGQRDAALRVVAGGEAVLALIIRVDVVEIAIVSLLLDKGV
jgi:hypothetical protein